MILLNNSLSYPISMNGPQDECLSCPRPQAPLIKGPLPNSHLHQPEKISLSFPVLKGRCVQPLCNANLP